MLHEIHSQMVPKHKQHTMCIQEKSLFSFSGFSYLGGRGGGRRQKKKFTTFRCYSPSDPLCAAVTPVLLSDSSAPRAL